MGQKNFDSYKLSTQHIAMTPTTTKMQEQTKRIIAKVCTEEAQVILPGLAQT